jgi:bifunctional UDP-N-acetylglucosamine pyrophosphorylase/glucosamine-1-phosphate N-acetyltransferase
MPDLVAIVLAAGKGTRMGSDLAKVLHRLGGEPLVAYPIRAAQAVGAAPIVVVVGYQAERVRAEVSAAFPDDPSLRFAEQLRQDGTGHAVLCALPQVPDRAEVALVLSGDVPLLASDTMRRLVDAARSTSSGLSVATFFPPDSTGYGRIVRDAKGRVLAIREQRDASETERAIRECNAGTYAVAVTRLREELPAIGRDNDQGEIYLTDIVARCVAHGEVATVVIDPIEAAGVNTPEQLMALEAELLRRG